MTGFSLDEIATLTMDGGAELTDPDDAPEPPAKPVVAWAMSGPSDRTGSSVAMPRAPRTCLARSTVSPPALMVSDPPYGVAYDPSWRARAGVNLNPGKLGKVDNDDQADWSAAWALFPGDVAYVCPK